MTSLGSAQSRAQRVLLSPRYPPWPSGSVHPVGMGLCGLGLLSDNLGKILSRSGGATLWRSSHPRKPHLAPGPQVLRQSEFSVDSSE
ncbi:putative disabled-interacting protein isoform 2 [Cricetulus griseus]|nr:putative disabled-interacting protein isoform 2 [Cricetulus griseus]